MSENIVLVTAKEYGYSEAQLEIIRQTAAVGCSDYEVAQLLIVAQRTGLDPMTRQIYMVKRWNKAAGREVATPQTGIDGYRLVADRTDRYAPGREPTFQYDTEGNLYSATAYVKKLAGGTWHESPATAIWDEYKQTTKDGKLSGLWQKMPHLMLSKCAESLALRRAFPAELSGVYTADEMAQADNPDIVEATAVKIVPVAEIPAPQLTPTAAANVGTLDELNALGEQFYRAWNKGKSKEFAMWLSRQRTGDIDALTQQETIDGIEFLKEELTKKAAAEATPVPA